MRLAFVLLCCAACDPSGPRPSGWAPAEATGGPVVRWDTAARPLPEIPLPNNAATRLDPRSPTGRRLNISADAPTAYERRIREVFNTLDGFGTYAPLLVSFDRDIDVGDLWARHNDNDDFRDDALFLLNVDPGCARFGEEIALDVGRGRHPVTLFTRAGRTADPEAPGGFRVEEDGNILFPFDVHAEAQSMLFEERNEDADGDGRLGPGEDLDDDGVLDVANFIDPFACEGLDWGTVSRDRCVADHLMTFYDRGNHSLVLKPVWPLEQGCTHAVVLTKRIRGEADGLPIQSPFPAVNAVDQTADLEAATPLLGRYGLTLDDVAFAWTFTTGYMTRDLEALRAGLYGAGPFDRLEAEFPVDSLHLWTRRELAAMWGEEPTPGKEDEALFPGACTGHAFSWLWGQALGEWGPNMCAVEADLSALGGLFGGTFSAPDLLVDREGEATPRYPSTHDERWELDWTTGEAVYGETEVTFWCALPIEKSEGCTPGNPNGEPFCAPFPVILYGHGYGGSRAEITLHMGRHAAMGYAMCSLDFYGHGLSRWFDSPEEATALALARGQFGIDGVRELGALLIKGRDRDLNNDGRSDPGMDQWTADLFHTRDMVRQSALEAIQFVRILRSMDGEARGADGRLLGDVDGDGDVDLGGPTNTISSWGISLGGIVHGVLAGAEPSLNAVSPNAGGAMLSDISSRSSQPGVPEAVILPMLGQLVGACIPADAHQRPLPVGAAGGDDCLRGRGQSEGPFVGGDLRLAFFNTDQARFHMREFAVVPGVEPGDRLRLRNLANGEEAWATLGPRGWARVGVASDALDAVSRRPLLGLTGDAPGPGRAADNTLLADRLEVTIFAADGETEKARVSTFDREVEFQGTIYPAGSTLVALQQGLGYRRNQSDFRRFFGLVQSAISPADPGVWAAHAFLQPLDVSYDPHTTGGNTRVLVMPTAGDANVAVHTGISMGRAAGTLGSWLRDPSLPAEYGWRELFVPDPRLGLSPDRYLVETRMTEGDPRFRRFEDNPLNTEVIFDVDNTSDGAAAFSCGPSDWSAIIGENNCPPEIDGQEVFFPVPRPADGQHLRHDRPRGDGSADAFRIPLLRPGGQHGIYNAQSFRVFDNDAYMVNFTVRYLGSRGRVLDHEAGCDCSASALPGFLLDGEPSHPGRGVACTPDDLKICTPSCADAWGVTTPEVASCTP